MGPSSLIYDDFLVYKYFCTAVTNSIFLFSEEQIKQRKLFEKAEKQREMEITRQLVRFKFECIYSPVKIKFLLVLS